MLKSIQQKVSKVNCFFFFMYGRWFNCFFIGFVFCLLSFITASKSFASSGTFTISDPIYSGGIFDWLADSYSPAMSYTTVFCYLYLDVSLVSENSSCNPFEPTFIYTPSDGNYSITVSIGGNTWVSTPSAYVAPTPTPTPSGTVTPTITPIQIDIASSSALAKGLADTARNQQLANDFIIFLLVLTLIFTMIRYML